MGDECLTQGMQCLITGMRGVTVFYIRYNFMIILKMDHVINK